MDYMAVLFTFFGSFVGVAAFLKAFIPPHFFQFLDDFRHKFMERWALYHEVYIHEESGAGSNDLYTYAHLYCSTFKSKAEALTAECPRNAKKITFSIAPYQRVEDEFRGRLIKWKFYLEKQENSGVYYGKPKDKKYYTLTVLKADKGIIPDYLDHVLEAGKKITKATVQKKLYTNMSDYWEPVSFNPPSTLDVLAMEPDMKEALTDDLNKFMNGKDFYFGVGRAWKRGYLLYGPPGTGKSSLIGAISNFTGYDVYDLELTKVASNIELRQLLINVSDRAIVVVEDIDCTIALPNRGESGEAPKSDDPKKPKAPEGVTLSGLLNFTDGLWSSCGSERIFIFTTNYVEKLDVALLRPGRMDMHICMSYCTFPVFKTLASNYLKVKEHQLFPEIEELIGKVQVTPAAVIEELLRHVGDVDKALSCLVKVLSDKKMSPDNDEKQDEQDVRSEDEIVEEAGNSE